MLSFFLVLLLLLLLRFFLSFVQNTDGIRLFYLFIYFKNKTHANAHTCKYVHLVYIEIHTNVLSMYVKHFNKLRDLEERKKRIPLQDEYKGREGLKKIVTDRHIKTEKRRGFLEHVHYF